jgi:hypothetical protein
MKLTHEQGKELVTPNTFFKKLYGYMRTHVGNNVPMAAKRAAWFMFAGGTHMLSQNFIISNGQAFIPERFKAMERVIFAPTTLGIEDIMSLLFYKRMNKYQGWQGKYQTIWADLYNGGKIRSIESTSKTINDLPITTPLNRTHMSQTAKTQTCNLFTRLTESSTQWISFHNPATIPSITSNSLRAKRNVICM